MTLLLPFTFDYLDRPASRQFIGPPSNQASGLETFVYGAQGLTNYTDPLGHLTTFFRDVAGRVLYETNAQNQTLQFVYNPADELISLTDGKNQMTSWTYDAFGRVTNKVDALGTTDFSYAYDANDRLTTRTSAAKGATTYQYDPISNLTNVIYPVSGTNSYVYDGLNRLVTMHNNLGTSTFSWNLASQLASETGPFPDDTISYAYTDRRRSSLSLIQPNASPWVQTYDYDGFGRLMTVASPAGTFGYQYASIYPNYTKGQNAASDLISQLTYPTGATSTRSYDNLAEVDNLTLTVGSLTLDEHSYNYNQGFQRTNQTFLANNFIDYAYDNIGQLTNAEGFESGGSPPRLQEQFAYAYDKAWNLSSRTKNGLTETFNANNVNELSTISRSGTLTVAGTTTSPATGVNVSGTGISGSQPASVYADSTWALGGVTPANGQNTWNASATDANGRSSQDSVTVNLPSSSTFSYDANGNLLSDGTRDFAYDDENELTSVWVTNAWRSDFLYDGMLRRRIRREYTWSSGAWLQTNEVHYVCDGLLVVQERYFDPQLSGSSPKQTITYTRGNDLGGDLQAAGGIGGLLARTDSGLLIGASPSANSYYHFDGNGNVTCLINMSNSIVALYQYDPFGNTLSKLGALADANLYRFSTKEWHTNAGLLCYGYRFYDPRIGFWVTRDPIAERGDLNLYRFNRNRPVTDDDPFGLTNQPGDFGWDLYTSPLPSGFSLPSPPPPATPPPMMGPTSGPGAPFNQPQLDPTTYDALLIGSDLAGTPIGEQIAEMNASLLTMPLGPSGYSCKAATSAAKAESAIQQALADESEASDAMAAQHDVVFGAAARHLEKRGLARFAAQEHGIGSIAYESAAEQAEAAWAELAKQLVQLDRLRAKLRATLAAGCNQ